ncbi:hypothetical protein BJY52DRAFT_1294549, partial [Lactarius psammicola]
MFSLLDDYPISTGSPPRSAFLNLWLHGRGFAGFNDTTSGSNPACNTVVFYAIAGWDLFVPRNLVSLTPYKPIQGKTSRVVSPLPLGVKM